MDNSSDKTKQNPDAVRATTNQTPSDAANNTKTINQQKAAATNKANKQPASATSSDKRTVKCPACAEENRVKLKNAGKYIFNIAFPFTKFTIKIPNPSAFFGKTVSYDENLKDGKKCEACQGKKKIPDVTDDTTKYEQAQQKINQNAEQILEHESKLGKGGSRTTYVQGSELLFVGLGFNSNDSYENTPKGNIAPKMTGNEKSPQQGGTPAPAVVGKQAELAWPQHVGNYVIKCANKFNVLAGSGGITLATKGPLTISGGMIRFSGPSVTLGSQDGPLTLEGKTVAIGGENVAIAPTGGQMFVRGTMAATGNAIVAGHTHSEGLSFVKATCPGVNKESSMDQANKETTKTEAAIWTYKATSSAMLELMLYVQSIPSSAMNVKRIISVEGVQSLLDRLTHTAKLTMPFDNMMMPTGIAIGVGNLGYPVISQVYNFPHHHGIPNMHHTHNVKQPDINLCDTPDEVRGKVYSGALTGGAPADVTSDGGARKLEGLMRITESTYGLVCEGFNFISRTFKQS